MNRATFSPKNVFLIIVMILSTAIYILCDFYLNSLGKELMTNWSKTEATAVQEGNLLTSVAKSQPYLMASNYVQGIQLLSIDESGKASQMITFGDPFTFNVKSIASSEPIVDRTGFLHSQVYMEIPGKRNFLLVFDMGSSALNTLFFGSVSILVLVLIGIISSLRQQEQLASLRRERLLKLAVSDLIANEQESETLNGEFPELAKWWTSTKNQIVRFQSLASESRTKISLGDSASRLVHDIKGPLRNIQILTKRMSGLDDKNLEHLNSSIQKIATLTSKFSERTRENLLSESTRRTSVLVVPLLQNVVGEKESQYLSKITFQLEVDEDSKELGWYIDPLELERSVANLIDNAAEASRSNGTVRLELQKSGANLILTISDSGCGISNQDKDKIGQKGFSRKQYGTGLGVYFAKRLVEEVGGRFHVDSKIDVGTTVTISIPYVKEEATETTINKFLAAKTIVVVDDSEVVLEAIRLRIDNLRQSGTGLPQTFIFIKSPAEFRSWVRDGSASEEFFALVDYHFDGIPETGADLIKSENLTTKSVIFTSASDDHRVKSDAESLGVQVISKDQLFETVLPVDSKFIGA